jgi:hypothetical protein
MKETHEKKDLERAQDGDGEHILSVTAGGWSWSQNTYSLPKT